MNNEHLMKVLIASYASEKSHRVADSYNQHVFRVLPDANKLEIKRAVELLFNVKVAEVRILKVKGKQKRFGQIRGRRSDWKKAYVRLVPGDDINIAGPE